MLPRQGAAPSDLDHVAEPFGIGRFAEDAVIEALAPCARPFEELDRAVDGRPFLVARDEKPDRAGEIGARRKEGQRGGHHAGDAALHVDGTASVKVAVGNDGRERVVLPAAQSPGGTTSVCPAKRR